MLPWIEVESNTRRSASHNDSTCWQRRFLRELGHNLWYSENESTAILSAISKDLEVGASKESNLLNARILHHFSILRNSHVQLCKIRNHKCRPNRTSSVKSIDVAPLTLGEFSFSTTDIGGSCIAKNRAQSLSFRDVFTFLANDDNGF
jgi:hypothetical protein